jgi:hypothetical protein
VRNTEPLVIRGVIVAAITALLNVLMSFGVSLSPEQIQSVSTFIDLGSIAALVVWTRGAVVPITKPASGEVIPEAPEDDETMEGLPIA